MVAARPMTDSISLGDVRAARERIAPSIQQTPCQPSAPFSQSCGAEVWLKLEGLQKTGSFKPRGALNKLLGLSADERRRGVIAYSAGNHAQGVAFAAASVGVAATIVMPETTPLIKITRTRALGARVVLHGETFEEAGRHARALREQDDFCLVHAFEDPLVIAGQGSVGLELLEQVPDLDAVIAPIGGGGLIAGIATAVKEIRPRVRVFGVQSAAAPAGKQSFDAGRVVPVAVQATIAEGIAVKQPGEITSAVIRRYVDQVELVAEEEIEEAIFELLETGKVVAEGAGAAALAAALHRRFPAVLGKRVAVIVSGANIDLNSVDRLIERALVRQHRVVRLRVKVKDRPGALAGVLRVVAEQGANVLRVHHDRIFTSTAFWQVEIELTLETRDRGHIDALLAALRAAGHPGVEEVQVPPQPARHD
jgi:threonine dehydratase